MAKSALKPARAGRRTRGEKVADKEEAIVAVAYDMIAANGFARTTIAEIARQAGVAEGTVYLYFENKDALAGAVLAVFYERLTARAEAGIRKPEGVREKLVFLARHHLESIIRESTILELITITDRNSREYEKSALYQMNKRYVAVFDGVIREAMWSSAVAKDKQLWILRDAFFGGLEYAMRTIAIRGRKKDIAEAASGIVDLIVPGEATAPAQDDLSAITGRLEAVAAKLEKARARK